MNKRLQVVDIVVNKVLEDMKDKKRPIWFNLFNLNHFNRWTGKRYKGFNVIMLLIQGGSGEYLTMKQLDLYNKKNETKYTVKKGSKALMITFQKKTERKAFDYEINAYESGNNTFGVYEKDGEYMRSYFVLRYYNIFDLNDIEDEEGNPIPRFADKVLNEVTEGLQDLPPALLSTDAEDMMREYCRREVILFVNENCVPHFNSAMDIIKVPEKETFKTSVNYHSVCFHEAVHSTGSEKRINRPSLREYSRDMSIRGTEELIAEIGANMLLVESGYDISELDIDETTDYLTHWALWIKDNKDSFIYACNAAHKAVDFFLGYTSESNDYGDVIHVGEIEIELDENSKTETLDTIDLELSNKPISLTEISSDPLIDAKEVSEVEKDKDKDTDLGSHLRIEDLKLLAKLEKHIESGSKVMYISEGSHKILDNVSDVRVSLNYAKKKNKVFGLYPILSTWEGNVEARSTLLSLKKEYDYYIEFAFYEGEKVKWQNNVFGSVTEITYRLNEFAGQTGMSDNPVRITKMMAY